ncbi:MAG: hypothetical protein KBF64_08195 [Anaerolineaceae bacterium]|nr:hypothetical protein [Anaerolineaceae bacterium]
MRITRDILLNQARENAAKLAAKDRGLICIYIAGSLLQEDPLIGGITDIDLICVHDRPVSVRREVLRLSADVSLDLAHYEQEEFEPARKLRTNAWIGGEMENVPIVLHDSLHWYDFTRASATAQFWRPENIAARARSFLVPARQAWSDLCDETIPQGLKRTTAYLGALRNVANSVAVLSGAPLTVRRMLVDLPVRALKASLPNFAGDFVQLFTSSVITDEMFDQWLQGYPAIFEELKAAGTAPISLQFFRLGYYEKAIRALYPNHPAAAIWILLDTWTWAAASLPKSGLSYKNWQTLCRALELDSRHMPARLDALDSLLDTVEETVEKLQK